MWVNRIKSSKLELKLMLKVASSGFICILIYLLLINLAVYYIDHMNVNSEVYHEKILNTSQDFQNYITENEVSIKDISAIKAWDKKQNLTHIKLVDNNKVIYDSLDYIVRITPKVSYIYYAPAKNPFQVITFRDGEASLYVTILFKQRIEQRLDYIIGIFCVLLFFISIFSEFKKLVRDILEIKKGIQILEGGNLTFEIQSKRKDEITDLVNSINRMSKELDLQRKEEEILKQKNYDLVTSISHDIRTPLTTVNSYIDLILEGKYSDAVELNRFLTKIKEKSILINDLTDNLFSHFLNQNKDYSYNFETIIGNEFIIHLLSSMEESLKDKGYQVVIELDLQDEFFLKVDIMQIERVFNNLEGNLIKYARKSEPIIYTASLVNNNLYITGNNYILENNPLDSHGVGIINCQEIIKLHLGEMRTFIENENYHVIITLPVYLFP
ncbi:HAMP domain-containing sensor histidine kinase [Anaerocolumna aminovalerica]|jgi:signal transduction histidine kinase|uniref:histidine kinase n=1 Tax=Anaerocolumna aminovalerica TaxID=1527 RepID=A0A1I5IQP8_9FIRM|nr:HAMP domain-containing sensor histidine kinase [Anaerocolumna aminovalerica]MBU5333798.1 HAMP domain-containing histidine kinase [Anaerocolumna aminovalerica]MDU6265574.1 HAMP domain-containing sensor histidine kinase [Anaerocolumna aminovalerica]SFO62792.1 Signal transduction histidine kinase [Anaerocolumna aminovalerica]